MNEQISCEVNSLAVECRVVHYTSHPDVRMSVIMTRFKPHVRHDRIFLHILKNKGKIVTTMNGLNEKSFDMDGQTNRQGTN
jgi:hypothetical protein